MRRDELSRTAQGATTRRCDIISPEGARILSFRAAPVLDGGPPPYIPHPHRGKVCYLSRIMVLKENWCFPFNGSGQTI